MKGKLLFDAFIKSLDTNNFTGTNDKNFTQKLLEIRDSEIITKAINFCGAIVYEDGAVKIKVIVILDYHMRGASAIIKADLETTAIFEFLTCDVCGDKDVTGTWEEVKDCINTCTVCM